MIVNLQFCFECPIRCFVCKPETRPPQIENEARFRTFDPVKLEEGGLILTFNLHIVRWLRRSVKHKCRNQKKQV